jgi:hypothetical protein
VFSISLNVMNEKKDAPRRAARNRTWPLRGRDRARGIAASRKGAIDDFKGLAALFCTAVVHAKLAVTTITRGAPV